MVWGATMQGIQVLNNLFLGADWKIRKNARLSHKSWDSWAIMLSQLWLHWGLAREKKWHIFSSAFCSCTHIGVCSSFCAKTVGQIGQGEAGAAESKLRWCNLQKNFWSGSLAFKNTLKEQYFIDSDSKREVISSKVDQLAAIYTSKFKWAWRAQFLSHTFQILEINLSFEAGKMILVKVR